MSLGAEISVWLKGIEVAENALWEFLAACTGTGLQPLTGLAGAELSFWAVDVRSGCLKQCFCPHSVNASAGSSQ